MEPARGHFRRGVSIDDPHGVPFCTPHQVFGQMAAPEPAKPRVRSMAYDDRPALLIAREKDHFVGDGPGVEWRRYAGMNVNRTRTGSQKRRAGTAEDPIRLTVVDRDPLILLCT